MTHSKTPQAERAAIVKLGKAKIAQTLGQLSVADDTSLCLGGLAGMQQLIDAIERGDHITQETGE